jgi:hypothetical protein
MKCQMRVSMSVWMCIIYLSGCPSSDGVSLKTQSGVDGDGGCWVRIFPNTDGDVVATGDGASATLSLGRLRWSGI